jgi:hypothetical protein
VAFVLLSVRISAAPSTSARDNHRCVSQMKCDAGSRDATVVITLTCHEVLEPDACQDRALVVRQLPARCVDDVLLVHPAERAKRVGEESHAPCVLPRREARRVLGVERIRNLPANAWQPPARYSGVQH